MQYFREGYADDADYRDSLNWLIYNIDQKPSKDELILLQRILILMSEQFEKTNEEENIGKVLTLQNICCQ